MREFRMKRVLHFLKYILLQSVNKFKLTTARAQKWRSDVNIFDSNMWLIWLPISMRYVYEWMSWM